MMQLVRELTDSAALLLICLTAAFAFFPDALLVPPFLIAAAVLAFQLYTERSVLQLGLLLLFTALCVPFPLLSLFVPALVYSSFRTRRWQRLLILLVPLYLALEFLGSSAAVFTAAAGGLAVLLVKRSQSIEELQDRYFRLQDESRLACDRLESRQNLLLEQQDAGIHLAAMNERNRIARDIHDNVGHLLSSALLQTAALRTAAPAGSTANSRPLDQLQSTLNQAMSSVRESVHQLHESSVTLAQLVQRLVDGFSFCPVSCSIDIYSEPGKEIRYAITAMVKEALSNVMKHSRAGELILRIREHPGFYRLHAENDGVETIPATGTEHEALLIRGIGLRNMQERAESLGGQFRLYVDDRFCLFITLPKTGDSG